MSQKKVAILLVDDDKAAIKKFQNLLKETDLLYRCIVVANIEGALVSCKSQSFDCIVLNHELSGQLTHLDGINILHRLYPEIPILMLTDKNHEFSTPEGMKQGASDYLIKENLTSTLLKKTLMNAFERAFLEKKVKDNESHIAYIAFHDYLTNIPNRRLFYHELSRELAHAKRNKSILAVLLLDLDRFKNINDTLGHHVGDHLLKSVTGRFKKILRSEDILARLGGDEFGIVLREIKNQENAGLVAKNLIISLHKPFPIGGEKINISGSIGIATYPVEGKTVSDLIRKADKSMYVAKQHGGNNFQFYSPQFHSQMTERLHIENALYNAIKQNELYLCFQPIYNLADDSLFGVESLLRWHHPEFGRIPTTEIISVAEESGLIIQICHWVLNEAFRQYKLWTIDRDLSFKLTINLSAKNLADPNWCREMKKLIQKHRMDPKMLIFELTETDVIHDMEEIKKVLAEVVAIGIQIFIDDFGIGYSSINMIQNLPTSGFKIDQSCIQSIETSEANRNLVNSLFLLAENMGLTVVTEGVETEQQLNFIKSYLKGKGQGFFLSKPLESKDIEQLLKDYHHRPQRRD